MIYLKKQIHLHSFRTYLHIENMLYIHSDRKHDGNIDRAAMY